MTFFREGTKSGNKKVNSGNLLKIKKTVHVNREHFSLQENTISHGYLTLYSRFTCTLETHRIHCIFPGGLQRDSGKLHHSDSATMATLMWCSIAAPARTIDCWAPIRLRSLTNISDTVLQADSF